MVLKVAVIGAGAAGLAAIRRMVETPEIFEPVAFEMAPVVGGTWVYTDQTGTDERGMPIFSSIYKNLITNLPKEVMAFPDFPFPKHLPSFIMHQDVLKYLEDFTQRFKVKKYIKFNTKVEQVHPLLSNQHCKRQVKTRVLEEHACSPSQLETHLFDAILVCNGHYSVPLIPNTPGLEMFEGRKLHSHEYRDPEDFVGMHVLCLGANTSGADISIDLAPHADQIYLSLRNALYRSPLPENVHQKPGIDHMDSNCVVFNNGEIYQVDAVIYCTDYHYTFPFLSSECLLEVFDERVMPLYKHVVHIEHPTMAFIGLCKSVCPFILVDCQVRFFLASLDGMMQLPTKEEMTADTELL